MRNLPYSRGRRQTQDWSQSTWSVWSKNWSSCWLLLYSSQQKQRSEQHLSVLLIKMLQRTSVLPTQPWRMHGGELRLQRLVLSRWGPGKGRKLPCMGNEQGEDPHLIAEGQQPFRLSQGSSSNQWGKAGHSNMACH
ncbi:uncharacterized protein LOC120307356 isoform X1 [Crotalus tigris]|uniref:uncharacterized protein LOC120307356 isoform X1 n=1 Tax=Crotalus tigris TaxID=88082 RepID=UPI00192F82A2|nr:uncharacterized protein LOC120307356 isoform X1 [Crotalus tigris]